ncbi:hypothetical protein [Arthrobacter sp. MMS18-M83]|uniref:hypothetical protein n=1 Tax=Arthrobacter sp. MMS18-M83 TaxID=2996261 RepID=UPI00227D2831|nr:hypothetical protein [Arthrobacter sp. MMS18-M83]WAH96520.1 hypothetical protein OW521_19265 [Arthrobacter sp. MMS18-M83]
MMFSTRQLPAVLFGLLTLAACLAACDSGPSKPSGDSAAGQSAISASASPSASQYATTHDGRTILPALPEDCSSPTLDALRARLGDVAASIQPPRPALSSKDGVSEVTCAFSLVPVASGQMPDPGNAVVLTTTTVADAAGLEALGLPRLMMSPEAAKGPGNEAWFGVNRLSGTTEYVVESVKGLTVTRISLAVPTTTPEVTDAKVRLESLLAES